MIYVLLELLYIIFILSITLFVIYIPNNENDNDMNENIYIIRYFLNRLIHFD